MAKAKDTFTFRHPNWRKGNFLFFDTHVEAAPFPKPEFRRPPEFALLPQATRVKIRD